MSYTPYKNWMEMDEFLISSFSKTLSERGRMLFISDGSLTRLLEALYFKEIKIELKDQTIECISDGYREFLGVLKGEEIIKRDVWITEGDKKLVFAHSIIPLKGIPPRILDKLTNGIEPLGAILEEEGVFYRKNHWEFGRIQWKEIADELNLPNDYIFWARRYQIINRQGIMAVILEVFLPYLLEQGCIV